MPTISEQNHVSLSLARMPLLLLKLVILRERMVHKIAQQGPPKQLQKDLGKFRLHAIELGASDAKIIPAENIIVDERVRAKCMFPKCSRYGMNAHCPPHAMPLDDVRRLVDRYQFGIFTKLQAPAELMAGPEAREKKEYQAYFRKNYEIVAKVEAEAFYEGYYLALAFAASSCQGVFCPNLDCQALITGKPCRNPLKARASMEAAGMDVYAMATRADWDIYPIGGATLPCDVPFGAAYGLVLIY